jgi:hypothetical protein
MSEPQQKLVDTFCLPGPSFPLPLACDQGREGIEWEGFAAAFGRRKTPFLLLPSPAAEGERERGGSRGN